MATSLNLSLKNKYTFVAKKNSNESEKKNARTLPYVSFRRSVVASLLFLTTQTFHESILNPASSNGVRKSRIHVSFRTIGFGTLRKCLTKAGVFYKSYCFSIACQA